MFLLFFPCLEAAMFAALELAVLVHGKISISHSARSFTRYRPGAIGAFD